ncbi:MAG: hypothetical protein ACPGU7_06980 [Gammaproteobacteria bacterium]
MEIPSLSRPWAVAIVVVLGGMLWLEQAFPLWGQLVASVVTWAMVFLIARTWTLSQRLPLVLCVAIATAGEIFLSLGWGLYEYRLGNIPLYVPPGHVLMFLLGLTLARKVPGAIVFWVPAIATPYFIWSAINGHDEFGLVLMAVFLISLWIGGDRRLYSVMFIQSLALELWGTHVGAWRWAAEVPWMGLTSTNPPYASGAFYSALDLLVLFALPPVLKRMSTLDEGSEALPSSAKA